MEDFLVTVLPRLADTVGHSGEVTTISFCAPKFCCAQKNLFQTYDKNKNLFLLKTYFPPYLETWLRAWFCQNCFCNYDILF